MTKKDMLHILARLPTDESKIVFEAEDIGEVPITTGFIISEGDEVKLVLMEDFEEFEKGILGDDDEVEDAETGDDLYAFINAQLPDAPRVPEPLVRERQEGIAPLTLPSTF